MFLDPYFTYSKNWAFALIAKCTYNLALVISNATSSPARSGCTESNFVSLRALGKYGPPDKITLKFGISCVTEKNIISFSQKIWDFFQFIFWTDNEKW